MKIKLDKRLDTIMSLIEKGERIADIGTDHGKIAVLAIEKTGMPVIATDISSDSLKKAQRLAYDYGVSEIISFRMGDGLKAIGKNEADTIVIAGMGGHEIINILKGSSFEYNKYILVPHRHSKELRIFLIENNFNLLRDFMLECDGKFYQIIVADKIKNNDKQYTPFELMFGYEVNDDFLKFKQERLDKLNGLKYKAKGKSLENILYEINLLENGYES